MELGGHECMGTYVSTYVCEASAVQAKAGAGSPFLLLDSVQSLLAGFDAQLDVC